MNSLADGSDSGGAPTDVDRSPSEDLPASSMNAGS